MKVLVLTSSFPTERDPVNGTFVREHARAAARHAEVAVGHLDRGGSRTLRARPLGDDELHGVRVSYPANPTPLSVGAHVVAAVQAYRHMRRHGFDPDVIHAHFALAGFPAVLIGRMAHTPVVVTEHWSIFLPEDPALPGPLLRRAARYTFAHAAAVLPVSEALRVGIRTSLGIDPTGPVVRNAVDTDLFHPSGSTRRDGPARVVSVGLFYPAKGFDLLLEAIDLLRRNRSDFRLTIVGDGPERAASDALAVELGLGPLVTFLGAKTKSEIAGLLRDSDVFAAPSRFETGGVAVSEALASGLPVVATRVGGLPELVDSASGILAEPNAAAFAQAISAALDRQRDFDREAIAARARGLFGVDAVGAQLAEVYAGCSTGVRRKVSHTLSA